MVKEVDRQMMRRAVLLLLTMATALAAASGAALAGGPTGDEQRASGPTIQAFPGTNGRLAFQSARGASAEMLIMKNDGTGQNFLTLNSAATDDAPAFSPGGNRIDFDSFRTGNREIFVMNSDGSGQKRLTRSRGAETSPVFSPNGKKSHPSSRPTARR
jgi:hypothetical protein